MKINSVIFDLDGTLVNSIDDLADSMNTVLAENNFPIHPVESYYYFVGKGIRNLVINALPVNQTNIIIDKCFNRMMYLYEKNIINKTRMYEGISEMLNELSRKEIMISVLSNKADSLTKKVVSKILGNWHFEVIMGSTDDDLRKPNPFNAISICGSIGVNPNETAFVGDTGIDMKTAINAGMIPIGVLWGFRTEKELIENGAVKILKTPLDLIDFVKKRD